MSIYGNWFDKNIKVNTYPYNHVVINNFLNDISNRENNMLKICNQFQFNISPKSYESVEYLKYWHTKIDDTEIKKICSEIN